MRIRTLSRRLSRLHHLLRRVQGLRCSVLPHDACDGVASGFYEAHHVTKEALKPEHPSILHRAPTPQLLLHMCHQMEHDGPIFWGEIVLKRLGHFRRLFLEVFQILRTHGMDSTHNVHDHSSKRQREHTTDP